MAHGFSSVTLKDVPAIVKAPPVRISGITRGVLIALVVLGGLSFLYSVTGAHAQEAWLTFHVNFIYWFSVAAASTCFSAALHICNAQWSRPIRRIFEASSPFFLYSVVPLIILWAGHHHIFEWSHEEIVGKGAWLRPEFVFARDIIGLLFLAWVGRRVVNLSLRRDIGAIRSGMTGVSDEAKERWMHQRYNHLVRNWGGNPKEEIAKASALMGRWSPAVIIIFAVIMTMLAFDLIMSVDPHWFSTLFGAFVFMTAVYLAMAWTAMGVGVVREIHPLFRAKIERRTLHDLGKLLFGFGIFWAYLFWSHYLTIWYGNIPEETGWVITRMREQPWHDFSWIVFGCSFIVPFLLGLSRDVKQMPALLFFTALIVAVGIWLQNYLLVVPTLFPHQIPLQPVDMLITAGFGSAYVLSVLSFLEKMPLMPFGDLFSEN